MECSHLPSFHDSRYRSASGEGEQDLEARWMLGDDAQHSGDARSEANFAALLKPMRVVHFLV